MRLFFIIAVLTFLLFSCVHAQKAVLPEVREKVAALKPALNLSYQQVKKMEEIEAVYLAQYKKAQAAGGPAAVERLKKQRSEAYRKMLSREQFIKFQAIEHHLIKKVPLRS